MKVLESRRDNRDDGHTNLKVRGYVPHQPGGFLREEMQRSDPRSIDPDLYSDARMAVVVPETVTVGGASPLLESLAEVLASSREFLGAAAGWIGLREPGGGMTFPIRQGEVAANWLELQEARGSVWGFAVGDEPLLLNDLLPWAVSADPPLRNLLACSVRHAGQVVGYVALANKAHGFTSPDAAVLQGMAHHLGRLLDQQPAPRRAAVELPASWRRILDRTTEGVLVLDDSGTLVYANVVWMDWTGFAAEELLGRTAPFPFWIRPHDLVRATTSAPATANTLPFRRRDQSLFWCQMEIVTESWDGRLLTVAFLHQPSVPTPEARVPEDVPPILGDMPLALAVTDGSGQLLWFNAALARFAPRGVALDQPLTDALAPSAAAVLDPFLHEPGHAEPGRMGVLFLAADDRPLALFWLSVPLAQGIGFLFALTDEPDGFPVLAGNGVHALPVSSTPLPEWLPLLLEAGGGVEGWDPRWEGRTGLAARDVEGSRSELVLDWLFPQQHDRDQVADCFHQPEPSSCQFILDVTTPGGSRPMACTFLPLPSAESAAAARRRWLLLVGEPDHFVGPGTPCWGFVHQFTKGLRQLLQHHLRPLGGSARLALAHRGLPPDVAAWFHAIDVSSRSMDALLEDLAHLARATPGDRLVISFADLLRDFLDNRPESDYELIVELPEAATPVRVNPGLMEVVLHQLLTNAEQALLNGRRRITVRVFAGSDTVRCEIEDNGEGLPIDDWTSTLAPFFSTKGAFARDPHHAALEATGLGLTVARHLLALHQGQLELRSAPGEGTTVLFTLPRAEPASVGMSLDGPVLLDIADNPRGPNLHIERTPPK